MESIRLTVFACAALASSCASAAIINITSNDTVTGNRVTNLVANGSFEADAGNTNLSFWATGTAMTPYLALNSWGASGGPQSYATWGHGAPGRIRGSDILPHGENGLYFGAQIMLPFNQTPTFQPNGLVTWNAPPVLTPKPGYGPVTLFQTISGLNTGQQYSLDFWASGESSGTGPMAGGDGFFGLDITGESTTYLAAPSGLTGLGASQRYHVIFQPVASTITLTWTNWGHFVSNTGLSTELALDDIILNPVPEPASLMAMGLGALVVARRKRK